VARGARTAPPDAARPSFNSIEALVRLLTPENRQLLAIIRDRKPQSVAALAEMSGRAAESHAHARQSGGCRPDHDEGARSSQGRSAAVSRIVVEIDPYSDHDQLMGCVGRQRRAWAIA
jgi:hypothetical protein